MGDVGMDQVLEAVADAVAQLVLFSVEAEENNSMLPNIVPGAEAVQRAVDVLVDIASELAAKYGSEKNIQDKMFESAKDIKKATQQIVDDAKALHADQFDQSAKKSLLRSAKEVLQGTVRELHLADKYDVIKIVKAANLCKENVHKSNDVTSTEQIMDVARSLSSAVVALVKLVNARVVLLVDPILKRRLETANNTLKTDTQGLVKAMGEALKQPSNSALKAEQRRVAQELQEALDEIILVAQLSCKTMFDSLDLDFGIDAPKKPTIQELRECHERICREVDNLEAASVKNAADAAANALFMINGAIMQEVKIATAISEDCNDNQKADILEACDDVEKMPSLLTPATKAALTRNAPPQAKDSLRRLEQETKDASAAVLAAAIRSLSAGDTLASVSAYLDQHLAELVDGVDRGDRAGAARAAKAVADDAGQAIAIAKAIADVSQDPVVANLILQAAAQLADLQPQLVASTKAGLTGDPAAIKKLHDDADAMRGANARLRDAVLLDPAELLRKRTQELQDELRRLEEAVNNADLQAAARHLKAAKDLIAEQIALATALAASCEDPVRKKLLEDAIARLRALDEQLIPLAKAALAGDKAAQARLAEILAEAMRVADDLARAAQPTPEELLKSQMAQVEHALDQLASGLESGDTRSARTGAREAGGGLEKEGGLLGKLHDTEVDPLRKKRFAGAMHTLESLRPELAHASDRAIANPNDLVARGEVDRLAQKVRDAHKDLAKCFPSREERMGELARTVGENLDRLSHAASVGDRPGATSAVKAAVAAVQQQLDLSVPISASMSDEGQKERFLREAAQLKALTPPLIQATKAALDSPNDKHKQAQLDDIIADVQVTSDALARAAALSPAQNIADAAASINARLNDLVRDAARPDPAAVDLTNRKLAKAVPKQIELARDFAVKEGDPTLQKHVETNAQELNRLLPLIRDASTKAAANPRDKKLQKDLSDLVDLAKVASSALVPSSSSPEDQIQESTAAVAEELLRLGKAADAGDRDAAYAALRALREAGDQQLDLARLLAGRQDDPQLRADLLNAVKDLEELLKQLQPLTEAALVSPSALPALHKALDDAQSANARIGQLATKPTALQIIANAPHVHHALDQLEAALGSKDQAEPALAKALAAVRKQEQLVKAQLAKETDPSRKAALKAALQELDEVLAQLPAAVQAGLEGARDQRKAKALIRQGHEATDKSVAAVTPSTRDQLLSAYSKLASGVDSVPPAISHQSPKERDVALTQVDRAVAELSRLAPAVAKENPTAARSVTQAASKLPPAHKHFADSTDGAYKAPRDQKKQDDLSHASKDLVTSAGQLVAAGKEGSLGDEILDTSVLADAALDRLAAAVRKGNRQDAADALYDAKQALERQAALARALAAVTEDSAQKKALEDAARELERVLKRLEPATNEALAHPNSREAQHAFNEAVQDAKMANAGIVAAAHPSGDAELQLRAKEINDLMRQVAEALKAGDRKAALAALDELEKKMRRQGALCKALGIRSDDPNKRRLLLEAAAALQNGLRSLLGPIREAIERGENSDALDLLNKLLGETARAEKAITSAFSPQEEPTDEIMIAARHVEQVVAAKGFDIDESTPEGRIYAISRRIAQEMALMSEAASRGANSEVIIISRRIHGLVQALFKDAQAVSAMCKDPILRDQVQSVAHTINNIAVQLKIITAVKAAGGDADPTVKAQLVKCAKGLASNVVNLCNATEIASIRMA